MYQRSNDDLMAVRPLIDLLRMPRSYETGNSIVLRATINSTSIRVDNSILRSCDATLMSHFNSRMEV